MTEENLAKNNNSLSQQKKEGEEKGAENIEEIKKKLEECEKKCEEYLNGWKRERADFLNYKKEEIERIQKFIKYANEELILKFLPILDNFYLAEKHLENVNQEFKNGFSQIKKQFQDFLKKENVEEIETLGKPFDPNTMEVVEEIEDKNKEKGIVVEEMQKGYLLLGKVIRPAKVKISK